MLRDIWKDVVSSDVADDAWYLEICGLICHNFEIKRFINNQKVQKTDEIKRDIWKYVISSDVADDAWYNYVYNISSCAK